MKRVYETLAWACLFGVACGCAEGCRQVLTGAPAPVHADRTPPGRQLGQGRYLLRFGQSYYRVRIMSYGCWEARLEGTQVIWRGHYGWDGRTRILTVNETLGNGAFKWSVTLDRRLCGRTDFAGQEVRFTEDQESQ